MKTSFLAWGLVLLLLHSACARMPETPSTLDAQPGLERLVYSSFRPAGWDIYHYAEPGAQPRRLTDHVALDYEAVISPDGRWVVFSSERQGHASLFALDLEEAGPPRLLVRSESMEDQAAISPDGRWLVFVSTAGGNADIYRLPFRPDQTQAISDAVNLTRHPGGDFRPAYSPDGQWIAFSSDRRLPPGRLAFMQRRAGDIYLMPASGGEPSLLVKSALWNGSPAWSADGQTLYYYAETDAPRDIDHVSFRLAAVSVASGEPVAITVPDGVPMLAPAVMLDGRVAFTSWEGPLRERNFRVLALDPETGAVTPLSDPAMHCLSPAFQPGGTAMVCHGGVMQARSLADPLGPLLVAGSPETAHLPDRELALYGVRKIFAAPPHPYRNELVMNMPDEGPRLVRAAIDGSNPVELLSLEGHPAFSDGDGILNLRWMPDGEAIIFGIGPFLARPDAHVDVWTLRADGTGLGRLIESPANDGFAEFARNGRMVFRSGRDGNHDIFLVDQVGQTPVNLTGHPSRDVFPTISPNGDRIAFASDRNSPPPGPDGLLTLNLYVMDIDADGNPGPVRPVTSNGAHDAHVQFSPDGEWLIYTSGKNGIHDEEPMVQTVQFNPQMYGDLYAYRLSDGLSVRLTHSKWENGAPQWAPPAVE